MKILTLLRTCKTNESAIFHNTKNLIKKGNRVNVICQKTYPGCWSKCIGKASRNLIIKLDTHGIKSEQAMHHYLINCTRFKNFFNLYELTNVNKMNIFIDFVFHLHSIIVENCKKHLKKD